MGTFLRVEKLSIKNVNVKSFIKEFTCILLLKLVYYLASKIVLVFLSFLVAGFHSDKIVTLFL